jgi:penicillin-binding protein 1A
MIRLLASLFGNGAILAIFGVGGALALVQIYGQDLPSSAELERYEPAVLSRVYSGEGAVIAEFAAERRVFAPIEEVPELVKNAFISAEDKNFYTHPGVDALGIVKAVARYGLARAQGRPVRLSGASTITQQVMKNFLVGNARSLERKIKEAILAVRIDGTLTKDEILELYLNEIFFGARAYGVAAAAQTYFGKGLDALEPHEAAYLAALPKAPSNLHPVRDREAAVARRNYVLDEMAENGHLLHAEAEAAMARPLETRIEEEGTDPFARPEGTYFTGEVRRRLAERLGEEALYTGGLQIRATIDPELQDIAGRALRARLAEYDRGLGVYHGPHAVAEAFAAGETDDWRAALAGAAAPEDIPGWRPAIVIEAGAETATVGVQGLGGEGTATLSLAREDWIRRVAREDGAETARPARADAIWRRGDVVFVSEGEEGWRLRQIPELQGAFMAMDPHTGRVLALQGGFSYQDSVFNRATQAERQPGSSFKPFVYAAALDAGYSPSTTVLDAPVVVRLTSGDWRPKNSSGRFYGPSPLRLGLVHSRNLMTVRIAQSVGMSRVAAYAERFGVYEDMPHHLSYALGAGETTLWDMVAAYGMFANGGKRVRPTLVDRIQDRTGRTIYRHAPRWCADCAGATASPDDPPQLYDTRPRIMNPLTARQVIAMMEDVVSRGTAARTVGDLGFPVAGKTGTTNENRDAWFVGFSPNLVAGCFIGYDQPETIGPRAYGGTMCGPVFRAFMLEAMETRPAGSFVGPEEGEMVTVKLDRDTGERLPDDAVGPHVVVERFEAGTEPVFGVGARAIAEDEALFGDALAASVPAYDDAGADPGLPTTLSQEGAALEDPAEPGNGNASPRPPEEPSGGGVGLGTGGLY